MTRTFLTAALGRPPAATPHQRPPAPRSPHDGVDQWALLRLPRPLHTSAYTHALQTRGPRPGPDRKHTPLLTDTVPRRYVLAELALRAPVLTRAGLHAQYAHIAALTRLAHVQVRVLAADTAQRLHPGIELSGDRALLEGLHGPVPAPYPAAAYRPVFARLWDAATAYDTWHRYSLR